MSGEAVRPSRMLQVVVTLAVSAVVIPLGPAAAADDSTPTSSSATTAAADDGSTAPESADATPVPDAPVPTTTPAPADTTAVPAPQPTAPRSAPEASIATAPAEAAGAAPSAASSSGVSLPRANWEVLEASGADVTIAGWALDPDQPTTVGEVHVYVDGVGAVVRADGSRPDVAVVFPAAGPEHGFRTVVRLAPGQHTVCVYAIDVDTPSRNTPLGCRSIGTQYAVPLGNWESMTLDRGVLTLDGWTFDPDQPTRSVEVHTYAYGSGTRSTADRSRPDVGAAYPAAGSSHGWRTFVSVIPGPVTVCAYAIDVDLSWRNTPLGCRSVVVPAAPPVPAGPATPVGNLEQVELQSGLLVIGGWTFDPNSPQGVVEVHVYVDGENVITRTGNFFRPDVVAARPEAGPATGWQTFRPVGPGPHQVCVYAIDREIPSRNTAFGCRTVTRTNSLPTAQWDVLEMDGTELVAEGWAFDRDQGSYYDVPVHVYVDGRFDQVWQSTERTDVGAAFPGVGDWTGWTYSVNLDPGQHRVCVYAIDDEQPWTNTALGCRTITSTATRPLGSWDFDSRNDPTATVSGWAFDPGDPQQVLQVEVVAVDTREDGYHTVASFPVTADVVRPDVAAVFPQAGPRHGWQTTVSWPSNADSLCVDVVGLHETRRLQCYQVWS